MECLHNRGSLGFLDRWRCVSFDRKVASLVHLGDKEPIDRRGARSGVGRSKTGKDVANDRGAMSGVSEP